MTSVDSGVETSNDSSDSCVTHDKALEICPMKLSSRVTNVDAVATKLCPNNTPSSSSSNGEMSSSEDKSLGGFQPKSRKHFDFAELEPPAGISYCNVQAACGLGKGYEIIGKEFVKTFSPEYGPPPSERFCPNWSKSSRSRFRNRRRFYENPWFYFKASLNERRLRYAASTNNVEQVEALLNSGVHPNGSDDQFRSPLHLSACRGYTDVVRLLLERGANPNQRDSLGNTPLHLAACTNHVEVVTLLLKAGTDVQSSDSFGRNPLQLAQSKLKLLQRGTNNEDSWKIKNEVQKVIEMMLTFLQKKGQDSEAELLNAFQTRLTLSQTKKEVETDVRDLLASLSNLNISKNENM